MPATRGDKTRFGSRSAHDVTEPEKHASDVEDGLVSGAFTLHNDPNAAEGEAMVMGGAGAYVATDVLTPTEHTAIGDGAPHHPAVTLGANPGLALSTQELVLGAPATLTVSTTNAVTGANHTHAIEGFAQAGNSDGPILPLLAADPASPVDGETWVRKTITATGTPIGLLLALTHALYTRELSIYDGGAVYRVPLAIGL